MTEMQENLPGKPHPRFSYADYEKAIRGPSYDVLREIGRYTASLFQGQNNVLDIASGQGMVLDALRDQQIDACGLDNEPRLVRDCRDRGLKVIEEDVFHFLAHTSRRFDGINCSHLIEHLPYESILDLIEGVRRVLEPGGLFVLRWPNPRSGMTQFNVFWMDPTHDRFYDGAFVQAVLSFYGFDIVQTHYDMPEPRSYFNDAKNSQRDDRLTAVKKNLSEAIKRPLRWLLKKPLKGIRIAEYRKRRKVNKWLIGLLHHLFLVPPEAQIVARRGQD